MRPLKRLVTTSGLLGAGQFVVNNSNLAAQLASGKAQLATINGQQVLIRSSVPSGPILGQVPALASQQPHVSTTGNLVVKSGNQATAVKLATTTQLATGQVPTKLSAAQIPVKLAAGQVPVKLAAAQGTVKLSAAQVPVKLKSPSGELTSPPANSVIMASPSKVQQPVPAPVTPQQATSVIQRILTVALPTLRVLGFRLLQQQQTPVAQQASVSQPTPPAPQQVLPEPSTDSAVEQALLVGQPPGTIIRCVTAQVIQTPQGPRIVLQGLHGAEFNTQQLAMVQQQVKQQLLKGTPLWPSKPIHN
ncbi:unnamed protein product [Timema podura]|uniref:Uncharacterized protein n=1 Tax=Timema podura TaxID=61482 RepID=A0ABN7PJ36_TIMPD|nr:unnamed protein product [Timema podura]